MKRAGPLLLAVLLAVAATVRSAQADLDLSALSLEELMDVEVSLVSRSEETLLRTPAAVSVLTRDDIRRSGVTSVPEALRLVPGVQVARIDANKWAVSARGFVDRFAQKLLVLVDGRTVYSPLFSGVFWEIQDLLLEDVERIEVVRGPGATLYGANAVNGIISIVTRNAADTYGTLVEAGTGTEERAQASVRFGRPVGRDAHVRVHARGYVRDAFVDADGTDGADDMSLASGGFRLDWERGSARWTALGTFFGGAAGQVARYPQTTSVDLRRVREDTDLKGGHLTLRWEEDPSAQTSRRLQVYHDRNYRADSMADVDRSTWDIDFQQRRRWQGDRHETVWGAGYRSAYDVTTGNGAKLLFDPAKRRTDLFSAFLHHQIELWPDVRLSVGTKLEHNDFSGIEAQPGTRVLWQPSATQAVWAAATRAVRTPARGDHDVDILFRSFHAADVIPGLPAEAPAVLQTHIVGDDRLVAEVLHAVEAGYRVRPVPTVLLDATLFRNRYTDLRGARPELPYLSSTDGVSHFVQVQRLDNVMEGTARGAELFAEWQLPGKRGRVRAGYAWLHLDLATAPGAAPESLDAERSTPTHQAHLWPSVNLGRGLQLDGVLRYVGSIDNRDDVTMPRPYAEQLPQRNVGAYTELDLRLGWQPHPHWRLALVGRNLLHAEHAEFVDFILDTEPTRTQRSVHVQVTWTSP